MAGNTTFAHAQPFHRSTRSQATRNFSRAVTDDQVPTFSSTQAKNFFSVVAARKVVLERRIIWDDLSLADAIHSNDLVKWYKLQGKLSSSQFKFFHGSRVLL